MGAPEQYIDPTRINDTGWAVGDEYEYHLLDHRQCHGVVVSLDYYDSEEAWIALVHEDWSITWDETTDPEMVKHGETKKYRLSHLAKKGTWELAVALYREDMPNGND